MVRKRWHAISPCARLADEKKRSNVKLLRFQRREWDLNPRMTVLQTVALGHLAIPPLGVVAGAVYTRMPAESRENYIFLKNRCFLRHFLRVS